MMLPIEKVREDFPKYAKQAWSESVILSETEACFDEDEDSFASHLAALNKWVQKLKKQHDVLMED